MLEVITDIPQRAMVVCAHPDDAEIGAGGVSGLWAQNGCEVTFVVCTNGSSGSNDQEMTAHQIVGIRQREQQAAADVIGVSNLIMMEHADGCLEADLSFLEEIVRVIREFRPDTIFTHDPFRTNGFNHRDHRMTGITVQDAVYPYARDHLHFAQHIERGLQPHKVKDLMFWHSDRPNAIVDITSSIDKRIEGLSRHASQVPGLVSGTSSDRRIRERAAKIAADHSFQYGEAFRRISARR